MTESKVKFYHDNGYAVLNNVFEKSYIEELKEEVYRIVAGVKEEELKTKFDTGHQATKSESYFIDSGDKIRFFLEKGAFNEKEELVNPLKESINKIGHGMHDLNDKFKRFSYSNEMKYIAKAVGYQNPIVMQSMFIFKNRKVGGAVPPHTDNSYLITTPLSCMGIWIAFDDAAKDNGGMWGVPGSHKTPTNYFLKRGTNQKGEDYTYYEPNEPPKYSKEGAVPLEVEKGSVILLHGDFVHFSEDNTSNKQRHAYTLHLVESRNHKLEPYNWIKRTSEFPYNFLYDVKV